MRLLDTTTCRFVWIEDPRRVRYAILSHVWDLEGEQSFLDLQRITSEWIRTWSHLSESHFPSELPPAVSATDKTGDHSIDVDKSLLDGATNFPHTVSAKIRYSCAYALSNGYQYIWIDSCCIDKASSAELTEAINSMYKWYQLASICYAFLSDVTSEVDPHRDARELRQSRWFSRGWTLQELIAPAIVLFLSKEWQPLGTKETLGEIIEHITGVERGVLTHRTSLDAVSVARRLSWASMRKTTREEDEAYCLLGIFAVNMPTVYGEGYHAFVRLQEEILKIYPDQSLFAWGKLCLAPPPQSRDGFQLLAVPDRDPNDIPCKEVDLFAMHPAAFRHSMAVTPISRHALAKRLLADIPVARYTATSYGYRTTLPIIPISSGEGPASAYLAVLACTNDRGDLIGLLLHRQPDTRDEYWVGCDTLLLEYATFRVRYDGIRAAYVSSSWLRGNRHRVRMAKLYISQRHSFHSFRPPHAPKREVLYCGDIPFKVLLSGWCRARMERSGYTVERTATPGREPILESGLSSSTAGHTFVVQADTDDILVVQVGTCVSHDDSRPAVDRLCVNVKRGEKSSFHPLAAGSSSCTSPRPCTIDPALALGPSRAAEDIGHRVCGTVSADTLACDGTHNFHQHSHVRLPMPIAPQGVPHAPGPAPWTFAIDWSQASNTFPLMGLFGKQAVRITLRPWVEDVRRKSHSGDVKFWSITYCLDIAFVDDGSV